MKYLCFILYLQISFKVCTIDVNIPEFVYISDHLTAEECRRLFASLHFVSNSLPAALYDAEKKVPRNIPCVKLLVKWNGGGQKWEGKGKTHDELERRLRQIGKNELADWLGQTVFHHLGEDVNNSLEDTVYLEDMKRRVNNKLFIDQDSRFNGEHWSTIDTILTVTLFGLVIVTLTAFCRMIRVTHKRSAFRRKDREEMIDLLSAGSIDSDQETVYEFDIENEDKHSNDSGNDDIEKAVSKESAK